MRPWPIPSVIEEPLGLQLAARVIGIERRAEGVGEADLDFWVARLERHADAGERAARAAGADEAVDLAAEFVVNLGAGRRDMRLAIGDIVELIGPDRAGRIFLGQPLGEAAGKLHVIVGIGVGDGRHFDELRALQAQHVLLFLALRLGDHDDGAKAQRIGDQREADAGIARRAFDDDAAGLERSLARWRPARYRARRGPSPSRRDS